MYTGCITFDFKRVNDHGIRAGIMRPSGLVLTQITQQEAYHGHVDMSVFEVEDTLYYMPVKWALTLHGFTIYRFASAADAAAAALVVEEMMPTDKPVDWYRSFDSFEMEKRIRSDLNLAPMPMWTLIHTSGES